MQASSSTLASCSDTKSTSITFSFGWDETKQRVSKRKVFVEDIPELNADEKGNGENAGASLKRNHCCFGEIFSSAIA